MVRNGTPLLSGLVVIDFDKRHFIDSDKGHVVQAQCRQLHVFLVLQCVCALEDPLLCFCSAGHKWKDFKTEYTCLSLC